MSLFNDALKEIKIKNLSIFIIIVYLVLFVLSNYAGIGSIKWIYLIIICYFIFKLKNSLKWIKNDIIGIFDKIQLKYVLLIVFLNIFFSYGMLYFSNALINNFPFLDFLISFSIPSMSISGYVPIIGGLVSTIVISPISEELIFRGVFLNRLKPFVPTVFAVLISSLLFASLHSFGSIISAFVFAVCMAILYIKTENIFVPIIAHFLNNLFAEIIRIADFNQLLFSNNLVIAVMSILAVVSAVILLISIIGELNKIK